MAGYASEVKLFGKWSFEDIEARWLRRVPRARAPFALGLAALRKPWCTPAARRRAVRRRTAPAGARRARRACGLQGAARCASLCWR
jgi:hypothetical protein